MSRILITLPALVVIATVTGAVEVEPPPFLLTPDVEGSPHAGFPKLIKEVAPTYPEEAKEAGFEGDVVLLIFIDERGKVARAIVQGHDDAEGNPITDWDQSTPAMEAIDKAAVEAALKYEFEPARQTGEPAGVWYSLIMEFRL